MLCPLPCRPCAGPATCMLLIRSELMEWAVMYMNGKIVRDGSLLQMNASALAAVRQLQLPAPDVTQ